MNATPPVQPRVLHIITILSVGGVEVWLLALLRHIQMLERTGQPHESFEILMTGGQRHDLDEAAAALGATLHYLPFSRRRFTGFAREFRTLLRERGYSAIHDHQDYAAGWHFLAGVGQLPPVRIVHVHNPPARLRFDSRTALRRMGLRVSASLVRRFATHILGTSSQILDQYGFRRKEFPKQSIRTVHCGFDVNDFDESHEEANRNICDELGWPSPTKLALFVGRLDGFDPSKPGWNHKNPQFALEVARLALGRDPSLRFVMVGGGGGVQQQLEAQVREWGLTDRIRLVGRRLDVARFMAAAHTLIFPSLEEGLGMVAVEAQAAGLHVVASDAVPREAVVIPELVKFLPLSAGADAWSSELLRQLSMARYDASIAAEKVRRSPYSIEESYRRLHSIYGSANDAS